MQNTPHPKLAQYHFSTYSWTHLSKDDLYDLLHLRQVIFVVEQNCPYIDADHKDQASHHVLVKDEHGSLVAYTRLLPMGVSYTDHVSIGRVVIAASHRGIGLGYQLMDHSIQECRSLWSELPIKISAQEHLQQFYTQCGFSRIGETYLEDDIPHVAMVMA